LVLERRRVRNVDDDVGAGERFSEALAGQRVDAGVGGRGERFLAPLAQCVDELRADEPCAADYYDFHDLLLRYPQKPRLTSAVRSCQPRGYRRAVLDELGGDLDGIENTASPACRVFDAWT